jgi:hypothetical protein
MYIIYMGVLGNLLGQAAGHAIGRKFGNAGAGQSVGGAIGSALPGFKKGGKVKKTGLALVHKGEYVLPKGIKPTKAQKAKVAKKKAKKC